MLDWKLSPKKDAETKLQFTSNEWDLTFQPFLEAAFMWQKRTHTINLIPMMAGENMQKQW